ncbi:methylmalonyl-CoA mutase family protein [Candidatus Binatus sp.]|jgi:(2R)-ethylmalonyl-CoA mutase|uniref:methylmalonyl-CoA mutase family protein n=4 Tax=Candidatus Binatus sp. TaxID=2811406 RepID=UPI003C6FD4B9
MKPRPARCIGADRGPSDSGWNRIASTTNLESMPDSGKKVRPTAREPWIIRTYAGFGDARQANERFLANLKQGQRGLSIAFDLPTQNGYDPDAPVARGEVGEAGVSICHWNDMERLFEGISLQSINTSMTINATAPFILALYLVVAEKHGVPWTELRGTTQNDLLKEFVARGTSIFHPELSFRLSTELIRFTVERVPNWNPINCCGYHYMESGAGPAEEIGYAFGNALLILDAIRPKLDAAAFEQTVRRISFFINSGIELVPEICKIRAYFKLWRELCASEYGVDNVAFRAGCQVRSLTLTEAQPEVNIIRIAYEALPVVISADARVNALQLPGFREALAIPDQFEQTLSLRTQQVLMHETGLAGYGDIFEGSKVIEKLTAETAARAREIAIRLREAGYSRAISIVSGELTRQLAERYRKVESGEIVQIGVNAFTGEVGLTALSKGNTDHAADARKEKERIESIKKWRAARDQAAVSKARQALERAAVSNNDGDRGLIEATIELARAGGTVGEWTDSLVRVSRGRYTPPILETSVGVGALNVPAAPTTRKIRIALGKAGLDGHINAIKLLAHACMQAGMEVVLAGFKQTPEQMVATALEEDVDVLAISSLAGAHMSIARETIDLLKSRGAGDVSLVMGGIIPQADRKALLDLGVKAVFTPKDSNLGEIVGRIIAIAGRER